MTSVRFKKVATDGTSIFYRQAGPAGAPKLLLLHGFPTSSHMFRDLIPLLADRYHIVAPDLPGFGLSELPQRGLTFDGVAQTIDRFTEAVGFDRYAIYVFDYGAPTGLRLAVKRITAIISRTAMPTWKASARAGIRSVLIGKTIPRPIAKRCANSCRRRPPSGNTRTASRT